MKRFIPVVSFITFVCILWLSAYAQTKPVITLESPFKPISTIYGTPSPSSPFVLSGKNFTSNVLVAAPTGFEVSTDNLTFSQSVKLIPEDGNAQLSYINLNPDILRIAASAPTAGEYNYTSNVDNAISTILVTPIAASAKASIKVNGVPTLSGSTAAPINLDVGSNKISIVVTAKNGVTKKTYTIIVNRAPSNDATLSGLTISAGALSPAFSAGTFNYTSIVNSAIHDITLTPVAANAGSIIKVNGIKVQSGTMSAPITLSNGANHIVIELTAQDGIATKAYNLTVNNEPSSNAGLSKISVTPFISFSTTNTPDFYTATVPASANTVQLTAAKSDVNATVTVNGTTMSNTISSPISLANTGSTLINVVVTAQDEKTIRTYKVSVSKDSQSNTNLSDLYLTTIGTVIGTGANQAATSVAASITSVQQIAVVVNPNATLKVNGVSVASGARSQVIPLNANGPTTITTLVTAPDGTTKTYSLIVSKNGSSNTFLSQIALTPAAIITQQAGGLNYSTSVSPLVTSVQQTTLSSDVNATIMVNGIKVDRGAPSAPIPLNLSGPTTITTVITAQDGVSRKTYTLTVARKGSTDAGLANIFAAPGCTFTSAANSTDYSTSVKATINSIQIGITPTDENANIKINGVSVNDATLSQPIALNASGPTVITATITAQDGATTQTYKITVNKSGSTNTNLTQLALNPASTLTPVPGTNNYTTSVAPNISSVQEIAVSEDPAAVIKVNGAIVASGTPTKSIPLNANGTTTVTTVVTIGGASKTYILTINKKGSSNTSIAQIGLTPATPLIRLPGSDDYTTSIDSKITSIQEMVLPVDAGASVKVNGIAVNPGELSIPITLGVSGNSVITTEIIAQDGISKRTFTITVTRGSSSEILNAQTSDLIPTSVFVRLRGDDHAATYNNKFIASGEGADDLLIETGNCIVYPAPLYVTATDVSKTYGDELKATSSNAISAKGLKNGERLVTSGITYKAGAAAIDAAGEYAGAVTPIPPYTGDNGFLADDYLITSVPGKITVKPAPLYITAKKATKVYGDVMTDVMASQAFTVKSGNLKNGNIIKQVDIKYLSGTSPAAPTGSYTNAVVPYNATGANGFNSSNYDVTFINGDLYVLPALVVVTVNDQSREFNTLDPVFTVSYTGFVNGENQSVVVVPPMVVTTAQVRSPIGRYAITASNALAQNYTFAYVPGTLTVTADKVVLNIPNVITPNGDGINDNWAIRNLDAFPRAVVTIFDRYGHKIFNSTGYGTNWDATLNGAILQPGTYYYIIDPKEKARIITGSITLIR